MSFPASHQESCLNDKEANLVEYEERLITKAEAKDMVEHAKRLMEWAIGMLPKMD